MSAIQRNQAAQAATQVVPLIPATGSWSGDNQLGTMKKFEPDSQARQTILKLDEWGPPEEWTISLYLNDALQEFTALAIKARIEFGVGGSTQIVEVDWTNGVEITKTMNAVNVIASYTNLDGFQSEGPGLQIGVQVARGGRGGNQPPLLTLHDTITIAPGESSPLMAVPHFASQLTFFPSGAHAPGDNVNRDAVYSADTQIDIYNSNQVLTSKGTANGVDMAANHYMPATRDAKFFDITNGGDADIVLTCVALLYG